MKKHVRILCIVLIISMTISAIPSMALQEESPPDEITIVEYIGTISCNAGLTISAGTATCNAYVDLKSGYSVNISMSLQRYVSGWQVYKSWAATAGAFTLSRSCAVASGYIYRVVVNASIYNSQGSYVETVTAISSSVYH